MSKLDKLSIFVCCHTPYEVANLDFLVPLQVGAAIAKERFDGYAQDDTGDHISGKNKSYCELTAQYWAWKNQTADYIGFFHYRRYLYPNLRVKSIYKMKKKPDYPTLHGLEFPTFLDVISKYDIVLPKGENMWISVEEHYNRAPFHRKNDLEVMKQAVLALRPEYQQAMEAYLSQTVSYFGNMFVMKQDIFAEYCNFIFPILARCEEKIDLSGRTIQEKRVFGYLGERLLGVFYTHHRGKLNCLKLPRVHFEPEQKRRIKGKILSLVLPAGTRRRAVVKRGVSK